MDRGSKFRKSQKKINHHINVDDNKTLAKNEKELETFIQTMKIYNQDIGMEFEIEKCIKLIINCGKGIEKKEIELPDQESISTLEEKKN